MYNKLTSLILLIYAFVGFVACSDDHDDPLDNESESYDAQDDLLYGKVIYSIDLASLTDGDYFINAREPVDFFTYSTNAIELVVEDHNTYQSLSAKVSDSYKGERLVFPAYAVGRVSGDQRNVIIVAENTLKNEEANLSDISPLFPTYGNFLGKGTRCYEKLGNTTRDILLFNRLPLEDGNLFNYSNINKTSVDEIHDTSFESVTKSWAFNVGLSGSAKGFSGGLSFGMHDMSKQSKDYEYFMSYLKVERTEMSLLTEELEKMAVRDNKSAQTLLGYFATSFSEDLMEKTSSSFNAKAFYNTWGTDMIYQGTLGGECKFVFTREENTYQHTIGTDIKAYVNHQKEVEPNTKMGDWYNIFMQKSNEPDFKSSVDVSWQKEEYRKASHSELKIDALGGNASTDPKEWLKAFQNDEEYSKWSIVSYLTSRDRKSDDSWYLYRIDSIGTVLVNAVEKIFEQTHNMTLQDRQVIKNARRNIEILKEKRKDILEEYKVQEAEKTPLVVADIMMVYKEDRRKSGQPQPFTAPNPTNSSQYLTYYPVICNDNYNFTKYSTADNKMRGKPVDTNDPLFVAAARKGSHYWYYAMAHVSDDCPGITDIELLNVDEARDSRYEDYHPHGDHAGNGVVLANKERRCYVKYFDKNDQNSGKRITAVGLYDDSGSKKFKSQPTQRRIFGSTGGAAWLPNYTGSQRKLYFEDFWGTKNLTETRNHFYAGGWGVYPHPIKLVYTTDSLKVQSLKDLPKVKLPTW